MATRDTRWIQRFDHFKNAFQTIEAVLPLFAQMTELEKDGLIQRFEITFDLSWKVMQDYLKEAGYADIKGPRACIKQMAQDNHLDGFYWEEMLNARNELSHVYDEAGSRNYLDKIVNDYTPVFKAFSLKMTQKI